jgi:hypothetical protein
MKKFVACCLIASLAVPATAQPAPQAAPRVCKTEDTIGTRLGAHKVCKTSAEWREEAEQNRAATQDLQQAASGLNPPDPAPPAGTPSPR